MNLGVLKRTRRAPQAGDIFVMQPPDGRFLYGRVISTSAAIGPMKDCILIYIYRPRSSEKMVVPELNSDDLLVPPMLTNKLAWSKGFFELIDNRPLTPEDRLPQHCFARSWTTPPQYFDDIGNQRSEPVQPVGEYGLQSYRTIDDRIPTALGLPLAVEN